MGGRLTRGSATPHAALRRATAPQRWRRRCVQKCGWPSLVGATVARYSGALQWPSTVASTMACYSGPLQWPLTSWTLRASSLLLSRANTEQPTPANAEAQAAIASWAVAPPSAHANAARHLYGQPVWASMWAGAVMVVVAATFEALVLRAAMPVRSACWVCTACEWRVYCVRNACWVCESEWRVYCVRSAC